MKPKQENFDQLRRLLKLKHHEQPPPRYFNDFSSQIVARIRAGDAGGRGTLEGESWLARLWSLIEARPMLPGAIGVAFCAMLVFGAVYTETTTSALGPEFIQSRPAATSQDSIFALNQNQRDSRPVPTAFTNANVVIGVPGSLFDQIPLPPTELISRPFSK